MRPSVLIVSLERSATFETDYGELLKELAARARLVQASSQTRVISFLMTHNPVAVLVTDGAIARSDRHTQMRHNSPAENTTDDETSTQNTTPDDVLTEILLDEEPHEGYAGALATIMAYAQHGGMVIFCCDFARDVSPAELDLFFSEHLEVPWRTASHPLYLADNSTPNPSGVKEPTVRRITLRTQVAGPLAAVLPCTYHLQAVFLQDVDFMEQLYFPVSLPLRPQTHASEHHLFLPADTWATVDETNRTPILRARVDDGHIAFIGDLNHEPGSQAIILALSNPR